VPTNSIKQLNNLCNRVHHWTLWNSLQDPSLAIIQFFALKDCIILQCRAHEMLPQNLHKKYAMWTQILLTYLTQQHWNCTTSQSS